MASFVAVTACIFNIGLKESSVVPSSLSLYIAYLPPDPKITPASKILPLGKRANKFILNISQMSALKDSSGLPSAFLRLIPFAKGLNLLF